MDGDQSDRSDKELKQNKKSFKEIIDKDKSEINSDASFSDNFFDGKTNDEFELNKDNISISSSNIENNLEESFIIGDDIEFEVQQRSTSRESVVNSQNHLINKLNKSNLVQQLNKANEIVESKCDDNIYAEGNAEVMENNRMDPNEIVDTQENEMVVLDPDHPLMQRFQSKLNKHLNNVNEKLAMEIRELEEAVKRKCLERENLGVELYGYQQSLAKCQSELEEIHDLQNKAELDKKLAEKQLGESRNLHNKEISNVKADRKNITNLQNELTSLSSKVYHLEKAKLSIESDLMVVKKTGEKINSDNDKDAVFKKQQDLYVDRLVQVADKLKEDIELSRSQIEAQKMETNSVQVQLTEAQMEIDTIHLERNQLYQQWNSSLIGMRRRDEAHSAMVLALKEQEEKVLKMNTEIEAFKKVISKEEERNEKLTSILSKTKNDMNTTKKMLALCAKKHGEAKEEYGIRSKMLAESEQCLSKLAFERTSINTALQSHRIQLEIVNKTIVNLEDEILEKIRSHIMTNKSAQYVHQLLKKARKSTRDLETMKNKMENSISTLISNGFEFEARIDQLNQVYKIVKDDLDKQNNKITKIETEIQKGNMSVTRKQQTIDLMTKRVEELIEKAGGLELGPLELQINSLKRQIEGMGESLREMKNAWLHDQNELVKLSLAKDDDYLMIDKAQKQITILTQKRIRTENEINRQTALSVDYEKQFDGLQTDLVRLNKLIYFERNNEEELATLTNWAEFQFCSKLKDREIESLNMDEKLNGLKEEKERLLNSLIEAERQIMLWEKKVQIGRETKSAVDSEIGRSEIRTMRSEIHRMQVRYNQLKIHQDKLMEQLDKTVNKRESIMYRGEGQKTRGVTKSDMRKELSNLKKKIKCIVKDVTEADLNLVRLNKDRNDLSGLLDGKERERNELVKEANKMDAVIGEITEKKWYRMDVLLEKQQHTKWLNQLKEGKYKPVYKDVKILDVELAKQQERLKSLTNIVSRLCNQHPEFYGVLRKVNRALKEK